MAVKCYKNKEEAEEESSILGQIKQLTKDCQGIVPYYGMKRLIIQLSYLLTNLRRISDDIAFEGYVLFFEEC